MENIDKKKRGCNYTPFEKETFMGIVKKYISIIENKETNALIISKKRKAWDEVAQQYNAVAVSGLRSWNQLRHLYENLKQRTKKSVAKGNRLQFYENEKNLKDIKKKASDDKKEIIKTGGGSYTSVLSETEQQMLAMIAPQTKPLKNPYDDAAPYFGDLETVTTFAGTSSDPHFIIDDAEIVIECDNPIIHDDILIDDGADNTVNEVFNINNEENETKVTRQNNKNKKLNKKKQSSSIKDAYFQRKLNNAKLERKYMAQRNRMDVQKHNLEMEILRRTLKKMPRK